LRERALALLPDVAWRAFVQEVRAITVREPAVAAGRDRARQVAMPLVQGLVWVLGALVFGVTATLVLTLIADAIR